MSRERRTQRTLRKSAKVAKVSGAAEVEDGWTEAVDFFGGDALDGAEVFEGLRVGADNSFERAVGEDEEGGEAGFCGLVVAPLAKGIV